MNPFDFVNSVNDTKKDIMTDENETYYNSFLTNRSLSYFMDSVLLANEMNRWNHLDSRLQYDFFINTLRKRKRFSKWQKNTESKEVSAIKEYYGYSEEKALQVLPLLSEQQLRVILHKVDKGGRK